MLDLLGFFSFYPVSSNQHRFALATELTISPLVGFPVSGGTGRRSFARGKED